MFFLIFEHYIFFLFIDLKETHSELGMWLCGQSFAA